MIQILALRGAEVWFERGLRATSVEEIFENPFDFIESVDKSERYNIYYTASECLEEPGRKFLKQYHIPFDIDGILVPDDPKELEPLARIVCAAIGVEFDETAVLFTGNGIQLLIGIEHAIEDVDYFDKARSHYRAICDRIDLRLVEHKLQGKADPSVWSRARLLRYPCTLNRKANKPERTGAILQGNILRGSFKLESASGLPDVATFDHINPTIAASLFTPDQDEIMHPVKGCAFLNWTKSSPKDVSEPQWYAALSVVGRFPNGREAVHDVSKGHPKYKYEETELKAKQALEASGPRTCKNINALWGKCQTCVHFDKFTSPIAIVGEKHIRTINSGFHMVRLNENGKTIKGKPAYEDLLKYFQRQHDYVSVKETPEIYAWNGQFWTLMMTDDVKVFAQKHFDPKPDMKMRNEFYGHVKFENMVERDWFQDKTLGFFNFENGVYDVKDHVLRPHYKDCGFKFVLPAEYDATAECKQFSKFMSQITCNRKELELVLQEFMGYVLSGMEPTFHFALALLGTGANGKSTFVNVLRTLCGKGAHSSLSLKGMQSDQKRYLLMNKLMNVAEENSRDSFRDTELVKNFISGGVIDVKQLYSQPFEYKNNSKLIALFNELPSNFDHTSGFYRRLLLVPFDAEFSGDDVDYKILDKLKREISGIFNYAIEGYKRLIQQNGFTKSQAIRDAIEQYTVDSSEVRSWFKDEVVYRPDTSFHMEKQVIFENYLLWSERAGNRFPLNRIHFFRELRTVMKSMGLNYKEKHGGADGDRFKAVHGVHLKERGLNLVVDYKKGYPPEAKMEEF